MSLADIYSHGDEVFGDREEFNQWIFQPIPALDNKATDAFLDNPLWKRRSMQHHWPGCLWRLLLIMLVYRLSNTQNATDLTGKGARLNGGCWNHAGTPCLYTAESRALAVLEFFVTVNMARLLRTLSMVQIEIPDDILELPASQLSGNRRETPATVPRRILERPCF